MTKIVEAECLSNTKGVLLEITLVSGDILVGHSWGIEPAYDAEGEELDYEVLAFKSVTPDAYFRLKNEDIVSVKKVEHP